MTAHTLPGGSDVTYHRLTPQARDAIRQAGVTIAEYVRHWWDDGHWSGDRCGCTDDRCIGHHHDEDDECGCLPVLLGELVAQPPTIAAGPACQEAVGPARTAAPLPVVGLAEILHNQALSARTTSDMWGDADRIERWPVTR